ncbi:membrane protease YdiL (CAAX protease family) [Streptosporangium becharense]|uniref:Membrane protease YdiL (CAAX protease family) n=1 Tax=Streptosporangium becharense TaxID=1816182 RepID=A0A7W9IL83_9ACTN|nr:CPBP family intramembrane glutamic endopeptidase [Streptosporangium becharense]MBB2911787.1 membrane protease YdiL (CAAX protease family) [Streptosporangium becharense]MBB5822395.1 membrane protease YdiL (CAAX protease family) [Streptosporangium becharense]
MSSDRQLIVFAVALPALVLPTVALAVSQGADVNHIESAPVSAQLALYGQAFLPAIAALITTRRLDWGFRRAPWRILALALALPVLCAGLGHTVAWLTGAARFTPVPAWEILQGLPGLAFFLLLALGEQLGWSSLLAVRLARTFSRAATAVIVGLAWSAFHYPLMLFVPGAVDSDVPVAYAVLWFTVDTVAMAFPLVWLRLRTGSIWPVLVFHAVLNVSLYHVFTPLTSGGSPWLVGEGGALTASVTVLVVLATWRLWRGGPVAGRGEDAPVSAGAR